MTLLETVAAVALGVCTGYVLIPAAERFVAKLFFGLVERLRLRHFRAAAASPPAPTPHGSAGGSTEGGKHMDKVAQLLGQAGLNADAMAQAGEDIDDAELVARFVESMNEAHSVFTAKVAEARDRSLSEGTPPDHLYSVEQGVKNAMVCSPSFSNVWFLWRLASVLQRMASPDVVEAARELVERLEARNDTLPQDPVVNKACAKLAAVLPKEG